MVEFVTGFDLTVEIAPGADRSVSSMLWPWVDVTDDVRVGPGITVDVGRRDERSTVGPGRCTLTFDNTSGDYCRTNPAGAYYGDLSKNTPLRLRVTPTADEVSDTFTRSASSGWGYATSGQPWYTYWSAGSAADFAATGTTGTHSVQTASTWRITYLPTVQLEDVNVKATVTVAVPTGGAIEPANLLLRGQATDSYLMCRLSIAPATNAVTATIILVLDGAESILGSAATGLTHAAATPLNVRAEAVDDTIRMRAWQGGAEPGTWPVSVTSTGISAAGWVGIRSGLAAGNTNVKPVVVTYDNVTASGPHDLFFGEVPEWAARWDMSQADRTVPITAAGVFRRLSQGAPALASPAYRALSGYDPYRVAYWPLEEESGAAVLSSPVGSPTPGTAGTLSFGGYTDSPSSARMVRFGAGGLVFLQVPAYTSTQHKVVSLWAVPSGGVAADRIAMRIYCTGGTTSFVDLSLTTGGSLGLSIYNLVPALVATTGAVLFDLNGDERVISIELTQNGADVDYLMYTQDAADGSELQLTGTFAGITVGRLAFLAVGQEDISDVAVGQVAVGSNNTQAFDNYLQRLTNNPPGVTGYRFEPASDRITRLCAQEGVLVSVKAGTSEEMGPQQIASLLDNLRDCEAADHGVLYEQGVGLAYQPRTARYVVVDGGIGAEVALALDVDAGELGEPPEPVDDDQALRNDITASRPGGGTARYEAVGAYAPTGAVGRYDEQVTANAALDARLPFHAQWLVGLGTLDDLRWPMIHLQLANSAALALRWLGTGVGSRLTVANPPTGVGPDDLDLYVEGWSCRLGWRQWTVQLNCSPARPFHIFTLDGAANTARLETAGATLNSGVTTTATSWSVATSSGPLWTTTDVPFAAACGGEVVTVTAVSGASSPQTWTVTRSTNSVVKAHSAGDVVECDRAYVLAL